MNWEKYTKITEIVGKVSDVLLILVIISIVFNTTNSWLVYKMGYGFLEDHFHFLFWILIVRLATIIDLRRFVALSHFQKIYTVVLTGVFLLFLRNLILTNFFSASEAIVITRGAFQGASDKEIAIDITEHNKWYPRASFVYEIMEKVPEDAGIAYIGDQRAHIISYLLYPRRVYVLPKLQIVLNESIQDNWTWSELEDPFHPQEDPLNPVDYGYEIGNPDPQIQEDLQKMIEEKDIEYIVYYDSLWTDKSWIYKLEKE